MAENDLADALSDRALDTVDTVVATVNDKAIRPAIVAARGIVFGVIIAVIGITVVVLFCVGLHPPDHHRRAPDLGLLHRARAHLQCRRRRPLLAPRRAARCLSAARSSSSGAGRPGLTAALYTARAQLEPLVIEGEPSSTSDQPGGQLMLTTDVENYPGFVDGIMGPELMGMMRAQALRFEAELRTAKVSRVDVTPWPFEVWVGDPEADEPTVLADTLIVATGARSLMLGVPNEERLLGYGVSTCATCDGFFFREPAHRRGRRRRLRHGGGHLPDPLRLQGHRHPPARRAAGLQDHAGARLRQPQDRVPLELRRHRGPRRHQGQRRAPPRHRHRRGVRARRRPGSSSPSATSPTARSLKGQLELEDNGYVKTFDGTTRTSVDGVFACGDVQDHYYRQAVTSAGSGCMAAIDAERWLEERGE